MIEAVGLTKHFRSLTAVRDLSFTVGDGEIFGLLGPNGAGKTTSVRMLAGLIGPSDGTARINGMELGRDSQRIRAITGVLTEAPGLHDKLTARENLGYYGAPVRAPRRDPAASRRPIPRTWSASQPRATGASVASARGCARRWPSPARSSTSRRSSTSTSRPAPSIPSAAKTVRDFVATLRDAGRSIVVCTHNLDEAERLCDRIGIMRGTLLLVDTPARLRRRGRSAAVRVDLVGARRPRSFLDMLADLPFVQAAQASDGALTVEVGDPRGDNPELVRALVDAGARIVSVTEEVATLEQVYLDLVGEAGDARRADRGGGLMRLGMIAAVLGKEARDLFANRLLLGAVVFPALIFAAIPTGIVAFIEVNELDPEQMGQIEQYIAQFPGPAARSWRPRASSS